MEINNIKSILITGSNGLLGRAICEKLSSSDINIFAVVHNNNYHPIKKIKYINLIHLAIQQN